MSDYTAAPGGYPMPPTPATPHTDWMHEARRAFEAADPQRAIYAAREALAINGRNPEAWAIRARSSFALEHYQDAEFEAKEAVGLAPHIATNHEILAGVYEAQERYAEALSEAREANRLDPSDPRNRSVLASIHLSRDSPTEAIPLFEQLVKEVPGEPLYRRYLAGALERQAILGWTQLPDGDRIITSAAQIRRTRANATRGLALEFYDEDLRRDLRQGLAAANLAETKRWMHSRPIPLRLYIVTVAMLLLIGLIAMGSGSVGAAVFGFFLLLLGAGIVAIYVLRHRKFVWEHDAETARRLNGGR